MSRIIRRDMLKVMAATAAGAAVGSTGIESVLAASPGPGGGPILGTQASPTSARIPTSLPTSPFTTYQGFPGSDFDAGGSSYTWSVIGGVKRPTNGGFYVRRLQLPQAAVLTECIIYLANPTVAAVTCFVLEAVLGTNTQSVIGSAATTATSAGVQSLNVPLTPTFINNTPFWYELDFESGTAVDNQIWGARIGYLNEPGLTLFPNPRRIVSSNMVSGTTYGPINATLETDGVTPSGIPVGATAAFCAVQSFTPGVLTIFPDLTTDPAIANYSGTGNMGTSLNMVHMMVPLSTAGKFKIHSYITGGVYLDAWGYLV
jgi:hypothetical protein